MGKGHKRGSKGAAGGFGGYRHRVRYKPRTQPMETQQERDERARRIEAFIKRGGRIQRIQLAVVAGAGLVSLGGWAASAERTADMMMAAAELQ